MFSDVLVSLFVDLSIYIVEHMCTCIPPWSLPMSLPMPAPVATYIQASRPHFIHATPCTRKFFCTLHLSSNALWLLTSAQLLFIFLKVKLHLIVIWTYSGVWFPSAGSTKQSSNFHGEVQFYLRNYLSFASWPWLLFSKLCKLNTYHGTCCVT